MSTPSLWQHADFLKLWAGQTVSELGSVVTRTAVPLVALLVLGAGPREMAYLVVAASGAVLLVGLIAGPWVDRLRRRPLMIWCDAARALLLFSIPAAYVTGTLTLGQLYVVAFAEASLGVVFDAAYPAYVPSLIGADRVLEANSKLATSSSIAEVGGPGIAGTLVQLVTAPFAVLVDAVSFVVSAISLVAIRAPELARPARAVRLAILREMAEGLGVVRRHPLLFPMALSSLVDHFFGSFYAVVYAIYLLEELHLSPFLLGIVISAGGVGSLAGSLVATRVVRRLRFGRTIVLLPVVASAIGLLTPLAAGPLAIATLMVFLPQLLGDGLQTVAGIARITLRQGVVPDRVLGRVNATVEVLSHGVGPFGALVAAVVAEQLGVRGAIAIGWLGGSLAVLFLVFSPLPRVDTPSSWSEERLATGRRA
ncbi:MAG TPA: MFS transporter [Candidatus Limnocylindria bacterium]|nr:MFS transporter [Candidatus Limnocylindria bacterium]